MESRITTDDVAKVARLARLRLTNDELDRFTHQLSDILDHAADMEALDLDADKLQVALVENYARTTGLWADDLATAQYERVLRFKPGFNSRGVRMTSATEFPPNPNLYTCQWCPYGPWNGGPCTVGVKRGYNA